MRFTESITSEHCYGINSSLQYFVEIFIHHVGPFLSCFFSGNFHHNFLLVGNSFNEDRKKEWYKRGGENCLSWLFFILSMMVNLHKTNCPLCIVFLWHISLLHNWINDFECSRKIELQYNSITHHGKILSTFENE